MITKTEKIKGIIRQFSYDTDKLSGTVGQFVRNNAYSIQSTIDDKEYIRWSPIPLKWVVTKGEKRREFEQKVINLIGYVPTLKEVTEIWDEDTPQYKTLSLTGNCHIYNKCYIYLDDAIDGDEVEFIANVDGGNVIKGRLKKA
jgi:hypothetical protein